MGASVLFSSLIAFTSAAFEDEETLLDAVFFADVLTAAFLPAVFFTAVFFTAVFFAADAFAVLPADADVPAPV